MCIHKQYTDIDIHIIVLWGGGNNSESAKVAIGRLDSCPNKCNFFYNYYCTQGYNIDCESQMYFYATEFCACWHQCYHLKKNLRTALDMHL